MENEVILKRLREIGFDCAQGFGIAMPEPLEQDEDGAKASSG
jgi:EAL domain-containing protein (putative c-di-GMP-specific phosphodiesterase class I)